LQDAVLPESSAFSLSGKRIPSLRNHHHEAEVHERIEQDGNQETAEEASAAEEEAALPILSAWLR
jgi:hypothetical protein